MMLALGAWAVSLPSVAVQATIGDGCGNSVIGTGASASVAGNGDITIAGVTAPYVAFSGCASPAPAKPSCVLSASQTRVAPTGSVTLYAKCSSSPTSWSWIAPSDTPSVPTGQSTTIQFPAPGAYTYSVSAANANGAGSQSNQVTILVGDATVAPICTLTASPVTLFQGSKSRLQAVCQPDATSYTWTADAGAPLTPLSPSVSGAEVTFPSAGVFTYHVQGAIGAAGPLASATVTVQSGMGASAAMSPASVGVSGTSTYTVTLSNPTSSAASGVGFTASYPANLVNAATPGASTTCGGSISATAGGSSLALTGASIPASGTCLVSVSLRPTLSGSFTVSTGTITSSNFGNIAGASAVLASRELPTVTMAFAPATVGVGVTSRLTITLWNTNPVALTNAAFTDSYPANLTNAATPTAANTCGGSVSATGNGTSIGLSGATLPPSSTCTVSVDVLSSTTGSYVNTIAAGALSTANGGSNPSSASATLTVDAGCQAPGYDQGPLGVPAHGSSTNTPVTGANRVVYSVALGSGEITLVVGPSASGPSPSNVVMTLTTTPGEYNAANAVCSKTGPIGTSLLLHAGGGAPAGACSVTPGATYYFNVRHVTGTSTCGQTSSCSQGTCWHQLWNQ